MRALILGGTTAALRLAQLLHGAGWSVTTLLDPSESTLGVPPGEVQFGGFGGPANLVTWLLDQRVRVIVDASDPFDESKREMALEASRATGIVLVSLLLPPWQAGPRDKWTNVPTVDEAARLAAREYHHILIDEDRVSPASFAGDPHNLYLLRRTGRGPLPPRHRVVGPRRASVEEEKKMMLDNQVDCVVAHNTGEEAEYRTLEAARELGINVLVVARPDIRVGQVFRSPEEFLEYF